MIAGAIALAVRKGQDRHKAAGRVFVVSMAASSALGAWLGLILWETLYITFHAGVLALTLIASAWVSARSAADRLGLAGVIVVIVNLANFGALGALGVIASAEEGGEFLAFSAENYFFLAAMAGFGVLGDASFIVRKRLSDRHRIARHLWRMCFGFFIAAGSAFTGPGATAFPEWLRQSGVLSLPELLIFLIMLFWLVRTLFFKPAKTQASD